MSKYLNKKIFAGLLAIIALVIVATVSWTSDVEVNDPATKLPIFLYEAVDEINPSASVATRYLHADGSFSFSYPEGFTPKLQSDGEDGEVIVLENGEIGVQIATMPFDEDIALTPERIKQDIPDLIFEQTEIISVGVIQAVAFKSTNASTASSNEVWFVRGGKLYLVSAPRGSEILMSDIIKTWQWDK